MEIKQNPKPIIIFFIFIITVTHSLSTASLSSIHDILPKYGLPIGLLPDSVSSYSLSSNGSFSVTLHSPCYIHFDYLVYYANTLSGKLSYGSIVDLKGIQVKKMFLWLDVDEIRVDLPPSGSIYFRVGFVNKRLDVGQFNTVHSCGDNLSASWNRFLKLPAPVEDVEMLITE